MEFRDEWVLITGASSGFGTLFAHELAARGAHLIVVARREERLQELAAELHAAHGVTVEVLALDLTEPGAVRRVVEVAETDGRVVHTLINNAGFGLQGDFVDVPLERTMAMVTLNVVVLTELCHHLAVPMAKRGRGGILNVASVQAWLSAPHYAAYAATKGYVRQLTEALHHELRGTGVHVTALCPGVTATGFLDVAGHELKGIQRLGIGRPEPVVRAGMRALERNRMTVVPGVLNWLTTWALPRLWRPLHVRILDWFLAAH